MLRVNPIFRTLVALSDVLWDDWSDLSAHRTVAGNRAARAAERLRRDVDDTLALLIDARTPLDLR